MNGLKQYFSEVKKDCKIADDLALINPRTINNLKHNKSITVFTLERLCEILECTPNDILKFD